MKKLLAAALLLAAFTGQEARATDCSNSASTPCGALQDDAIYHYDLFLGASGTFTGSVTFAGATSGSVKITPQAAAGTSVVVTLPNASGTVAVSASSPLSLNTTTGNLSITSPLPLTNGGTNASLSASNGGIFYSTASAGAILSGTSTARQMLQSGANAAPAWSTSTWPATTTINQLLYSSATSVVSGLATANNGVLVTDGSGVPSIATTLPSGLTAPSLTVTGAFTATGLVANASLANMVNGTIKCRTSAGTGVPEDCTGAQAEQLLLFTQTGTGAAQRTVDSRLKDIVSVKDFAASGSAQTTTGTISGSSTSLALTSALDFVNNQGIRVNHAGAAFTLNQPSSLTVTPTGTTGSTHYAYTIASLDNAGGVGKSISNATTITGNASLTSTNYNALSWTGATGTAPTAYAVYGNVAGSQVLLAIVGGTSWNDTGAGAITPPDWLPSTPQSSAALADWLVTTISSGGGTTTLTLGASATTTATTQTVLHDDTAALNTAITSANPLGLAIRMPFGTYQITGTINDALGGTEILGAGRNGTTINVNFMAGDVFNITGPYSMFRDFAVSSNNNVIMSGFYFDVNAAFVGIENIYISSPYVGIKFANGTLSHARDIYVRNITPSINQVNSAAIIVGDATYGPASVVLDNIQVDNPNGQSSFGLLISNADNLWVANSGFVRSGNVLYMNPTTGQSVSSINFTNVFFDTSSGSGATLTTSGTGTLLRTRFDTVWFSAMGAYGVNLASVGTSGDATGVTFVNCHFFNNALGGVLINDSKWNSIILADSQIGGSTSGTGLVTGAGFTDVTIVNNQIGTIAGVGANLFGVYLSAGTYTRFIFKNNNLNGNTNAPNITAGNTFVSSIIEDNIGYNPVGVTGSTTVGASPATITAGPSPETHYFLQSATNTATVKLSGNVVGTMSSTTLPVVVNLGPNESEVITWTTTAPTYVKSVH